MIPNTQYKRLLYERDGFFLKSFLGLPSVYKIVYTTTRPRDVLSKRSKSNRDHLKWILIVRVMIRVRVYNPTCPIREIVISLLYSNNETILKWKKECVTSLVYALRARIAQRLDHKIVVIILNV